MLADGSCDAALNCEALTFDGGDCAGGADCGNGICDPGEAPADVGSEGVACATSCLGMQGCSVECLETSLALSTECATCFASPMGCMYSNCLDICTADPNGTDLR